MYFVLIDLMHGNKESLAFLLSCLDLQGKNELQVYFTFWGEIMIYFLCAPRGFHLYSQIFRLCMITLARQTCWSNLFLSWLKFMGYY
uniref:Uncharacterized protein n=1 Tax=Gossypium raimondii TaxID=29730 RepID=A0A0D2TGE1_GOSRA|nr:hypothetical protein B456_009G398400 [Gossypium raimondii]